MYLWIIQAKSAWITLDTSTEVLFPDLAVESVPMERFVSRKICVQIKGPVSLRRKARVHSYTGQGSTHAYIVEPVDLLMGVYAHVLPGSQ